MNACIEHIGADVLCRSEGGTPTELRLAGEQSLARLEDWAKRYDTVVRHGGVAQLLAIGVEMFDWLDDNGWASAWAKATGPRVLEIRVDDLSEPLAQALLDAPWELLARRSEHLADDGVQIFEVGRRIGAKREAITPRYSDLQLMFMAAAPEGQSVLDFESEEAAILKATERLPLHLVVEESGAAEYLGEHLDLDGPFEALHLSCHGNIHPQRGHVLALEDPIGGLAYADAEDIVKLLGEPERTPLVFLSACRTAEQAEGDGAHRFEPFVRDLTRAGIANVLGWDGSVYDTDAKDFAQTFYRELAGRSAIPRAAAVARLELRRKQQTDPQHGRHWHLARLYLGPRGGGALAAKGMEKRKLSGAAHEEQFLDQLRGEVPVAKRREFVGRRRQAQRVLKAFRDGRAGVLIHGMGNLGKSSLAARIASRMTGHKTVVVFRSYDALAIFDRVVEAIPTAQRAGIRLTWREAVTADASALGEALETLLEGPLDQQPMLLIIDDLEQILEPPTQSDAPTPVLPRYRPTLTAVLRAFEKAQTDSQLLITSRYRFALPDGRGGDLAEGLTRIPLHPMEKVDQFKQLRAAARMEHFEEETDFDNEAARRALRVAGGNPGLQAVLMTPVLKGETTVARQAIAAIESFQQTGAPPEAIRELIETGAAKDDPNALVAFFKRMAFDTYRAALSPPQAEMLRAAGLFSSGLPVPCAALRAVGAASGVADPAAALQRLLDLGLVDDWGWIAARPHAAANPLARPLVAALNAETASRLADAALPALDQSWRNPFGAISQDPRAMEIARLGLMALHPEPPLLDQAAEAAARYLFDHEQNARRAHEEVLQPALARLVALGATPGHSLLLIACDCAERLGERAAQDRALAMMGGSDVNGFDRGGALLRQGRAAHRLGRTAEAERAFTEAATAFGTSGNEREWAIARGGVADILQARGELDEALAMHEQRLSVAQRLGDIDSIAHIKYSTAAIRLQRGDHNRGELQPIHDDLAEAFAISRRLGRPDAIGGIGQLLARVLAMAGQKDEALKVLQLAQQAFEKIGHIQGSDQVRQLRKMLGGE